MVHQHQINDSGMCTTCNATASEHHILDCFICKMKFHGECNGNPPYATKSFVNAFKKLRNNDSFVFICPHCKTGQENMEASTVQQQIEVVLKAVSQLTKEVAELKNERRNDAQNSSGTPSSLNPLVVKPESPSSSQQKVNQESSSSNQQKPVWPTIKQTNIVKKDKITVCIKNDGSSIDLSKVKDVVRQNGIQVSKASGNPKNGDVYVDLPSNDQRDKLVPLLNSEVQGNTIVNVKSKCPIITIRNVSEYVDEADFIERIKSQNTKLAEKIEEGSEFSVVFSKEHHLKPGFKRNVDADNDTVYQVVVRVSDEIRHIIKSSGDRIFIGFSSYRVFDRFYVKTCVQCHRFGHYIADCDATPCCGYCGDDSHSSKDCPINQSKEHSIALTVKIEINHTKVILVIGSIVHHISTNKER